MEAGASTTRATVTLMTLVKVVAASGIAPESPRLQRGANLSQLRSRGPSARYRAAVSRLSSEGSAFELRRNGKMDGGMKLAERQGLEPWTPIKVRLFSRLHPRPTGRAPFVKWLLPLASHQAHTA